MLSRLERINDFHLKVSRTEKELYEEFLRTEEAAIVAEMQEYFGQTRQRPGGIRFDHKSLGQRSKTESMPESPRFAPTGILIKT